MRKLGLAISLVANFDLAGAAAAMDATETSPPAIPNVTLLSPSLEALAAANPNWTVAQFMGGTVISTCTILVDDSVDCKIIMGGNFAEAGAQIAKMVRVKPNDQTTHVGEKFNLLIRYPAYVSGLTTAPLPELEIKAEGPPPLPPVPYIIVNRHREPWVVGFVIPNKARIRTCDDTDPVVSEQYERQGDILSLEKNQRLEIYIGDPPSWVVVMKAERCFVTDGGAP